MPPPLNIPVLKVEGQGLSKKQQVDLKLMEKNALAWTSANGRKYEDNDFPCTEASLGPLASHVASWRRPSEFAAKPELFKNFWEIEGVQPSKVLNDRWLLGAVNIVAGNKDNIDRMFLSALKEEGSREPMRALEEQGAREGFYIVRFYHDDPHSDDDWCALPSACVPAAVVGRAPAHVGSRAHTPRTSAPPRLSAGCACSSTTASRAAPTACPVSRAAPTRTCSG